MFGCFAGSAIFFTLSYLFPAQETYLEKAILALDHDESDDNQTPTDDKVSDEGSATMDKA